MEKDMERPIERIEQLAQWLISKRVVKSVTAFERVCGLSTKYMSNSHFSPTGGISVYSLAKIYDTFPIFNIEWAVTGRGNMFKKEPDDSTLWQITSRIIDRLTTEQPNRRKNKNSTANKQ